MKIIKIEDTRQYEEMDDGKWRAIRGSGIEHICTRCGKGHEVHATVQDKDGQLSVVGTVCAKEDNMLTESQYNSIGRAARAITKLTTQIKTREVANELYRERYATIDASPKPNIVLVNRNSEAAAKELPHHYTEYRMGDAMIGSFDGLTSERIDCLSRFWVHQQMKDIGWDTREQAICDLERKLARSQKKMASLIGTQ